MKKIKRVLIGMSGGVDSSVSALLLKKQGYEVIGLYMKNWDCNPQEYKDVVSVCEKINIPYYTMSFQEEYKDKVFDYYLKQLDLGYNINPDVLCNKYIKFDVLFNTAMSLDFDYLATGHYASIENNSLKMPKDKTKDQTYFLYDIDYNILDKILFPLSDLAKSDVRKIAEENNLVTANKKDSTGICFIGNNKFKDFIKKYKEEKNGDIIFNNKVIGNHNGLHFYTIGQRKGLSLSNGPFIVIDKDIKNNTLIVDKIKSENTLSNTFKIKEKVLNYNGKAYFRFSNLGKLHIGKIEKNTISLNNKIKKIGLGQSIVFYSKEGLVLGGGILDSY